MSNIMSPMSEYYYGKTIFLTGGSGFLGQLYIQKLLRTNIAALYLFLRPKKNQTIVQRLDKLFEDPVFDKLKLQVPKFLEKIKVIEGSLDQDGLGISEYDRKDIIENVELVIHAAADVRFNRSLLTLVEVNLKGTKELLMLGKQMHKLRMFTYISTCYSNCVVKTVEEKFYDPPIDPYVLIELVEKCSDSEELKDIFDIITTKVTHPWPNTYTFTKAMSESIIHSFEKEIPITIIRPSIVVSTHSDPEVGWVNGYFGLTGLLYACALGFLHVLNADTSKTVDIVCADLVINSTLAAISSMDDDRIKIKDEIRSKIFNVASGRSRPFTFTTLNQSQVFQNHVPFSQSIWYPFTICISNQGVFRLLGIFFQFIPGAISDISLKCMGMTTRLLPTYRNVTLSALVVSPFTTNEWTFIDDNMKSVYDKMTHFDKKLFPSDMSTVNWMNYFYGTFHGIRKYIHKDEVDWHTGLRRLKMMQRIHQIVVLFLFGTLMYIINLIYCRKFGQ